MLGAAAAGPFTPRPVNRSRGLIPSERIAVPQISSAGVSNTRSGSTLVWSQAPRAISVASWPGAQPE